MKRTAAANLAWLALLATSASVTTELRAQELPDEPGNARFEIWLGPTSWPAAENLLPLANGSFEPVGLAVGGAIHGRIRQGRNSDLLVGVDGHISVHDSDVQGPFESLVLSDAYLGLSGKWRFGPARTFSLDAGLGVHFADIADIPIAFLGTVELDAWEANRLGGYVGATWDIGASRADKSRGFFLGFKVHYVDFGDVRDDEVFFEPVLGTNAGQLDGPIYMLQIGYSGT